jgi:ribosome-associated translation inhibitor RaiA
VSTTSKTTGQAPTARPAFPAVVELAGRIAPDLVEYVQQKIGTVLGHTGRAALSARVRIVRHEDPARERPVDARASVNLAGATVHAHAEAGTAREAADLLLERLDQRIARISRTRRGDRSTPAAAAGGSGASGTAPSAGADGSDTVPTGPVALGTEPGAPADDRAGVTAAGPAGPEMRTGERPLAAGGRTSGEPGAPPNPG